MLDYDEFYPCQLCFKDSSSKAACIQGSTEHQIGQICLRSHSYESLKKEAKRLISEQGYCQNVLVSHSDLWRDEDLTEEMCCNFCQVSSSNEWSGNHENLMQKFLLTNHGPMLKYPVLDTDELSDMIQEGVPVLDFLRVKAEWSTWSCPSPSYIEELAAKRAVNYDAIKDCQIKEIVIGEANDSEIREFAAWIKRNHKKDMEKLPVPLISFSCQFLHHDVTNFFILKTFGKLEAYQDRDIFDIELDAKLKWPVKMLIGNGLNYTGVVTFHVGRFDNKDCGKRNLFIPKALIEFLEDLPVVTGCGIRKDLLLINKFFKIAYGHEVNFRGSLDTSVLAVLAGWTLKKTDLFTLGFVGAGVMTNKLSCSDYCNWGMKFSSLAPSMQCYAICNTKVGWLLSVTFLTTILYNWFPYQGETCSLTKSRPFHFVEHLMQWLVRGAKDLVLLDYEFQNSTDVQSAICSIRNYGCDLEPEKERPRIVEAFLNLCNSQSTIHCPKIQDEDMADQILGNIYILKQYETSHVDSVLVKNQNDIGFTLQYCNEENQALTKEGLKMLFSRIVSDNGDSKLVLSFRFVIFVFILYTLYFHNCVCD